MTDLGARRSLDELDLVLIAALQADGRATITELARAVHLGVSATRARVQNLQASGAVRKVTADVAPEALGFTLHAVVRMKVHGSLYDKVSQALDAEPQIIRCLRVTGQSCYVMEVVATDMADLERITARLARVGSITTDLVYEVVADRQPPPLSSPVTGTPVQR